MGARPDQEEMEQAIDKFLLLLEKQEKKGFKDIQHISAKAHGCCSSHTFAWSNVDMVIPHTGDYFINNPRDFCHLQCHAGHKYINSSRSKNIWPQYCHSCSSLHKGPLTPCQAGFLPALDEDQANMFTPSELRLY